MTITLNGEAKKVDGTEATDNAEDADKPKD